LSPALKICKADWAQSSAGKPVRSLIPQLEKIGAARVEEIQINTLEERMRETACAVHSQLLMPMQFCGWSRV
jgi:hypothetical protein